MTRRAHAFTRRWRLTVAYLVLAIAVGGATHLSLENQDRIESEAAENDARLRELVEALERQSLIVKRQSIIASSRNCQTANELKDVQRDVLLVLVGPPGKEGYDRRLALFRQIEPILEHSDCPPIPGGN